MLHCWNEDPLQRPTFTELRDHLEEIMSQGCHYMSFDIDEKNAYYNVASYKSLPDEETEDDLDIEDAILQKPPQFLSIEDLKFKKERRQSSEVEKTTTTPNSAITNGNNDDKINIVGKTPTDCKDPVSWDIEEKPMKKKMIESSTTSGNGNRYTKTSELLQNANLGIL